MNVLIAIKGSENNLVSAYFGKDSPLTLDETLIYYLPKFSKVKELREYAKNELFPFLKEHKKSIDTVMIAEAFSFTKLTGTPKAEANLGIAVELIDGEDSYPCFYVPNYLSMYYNPIQVQHNINVALSYVHKFIHNKYDKPGSNIIDFEDYPETPEKIKFYLDKMIEMNVPVSCDIETYDLKHHKAGIASISFSWSQHEGVAFLVDNATGGKKNETVRKLLKDFFINFKNKVRYHRIAFDAYVLIYQLFMKDALDQEGLLEGIEVMLNKDKWDCTYLISYLALNSASRPSLKLKDLAQQFAGNWAIDDEDIKDVLNVPTKELLFYNLIDTLSTNYVYDTLYPKMVEDEQLEIYEGLFKDTTIDIIQMQLTGLPIDKSLVRKAEEGFMEIQEEALAYLEESPYVKEATQLIRYSWVEKENQRLKTIQRTMEDASHIRFNVNSTLHTRLLFITVMGLPVIGYTDKGNPSMDNKALLAYTRITEGDKKELIQKILSFKVVDKLVTNFIPAMKEAIDAPDGKAYLCGFFNLGGTISGRLSSSNPNLQNIPAHSKEAKIIKDCFRAPEGWLLVGLDYSSLEDRISALTTRDPNKLKVYMGHIVYKVTINGEEHLIRDDSTVIYENEEYTGEQFYSKFFKNSLL